MKATEVEIVMGCDELLRAVWWYESGTENKPRIEGLLQGNETDWTIKSLWLNKDGTVTMTLMKKATTLAEAGL